MTSADQPGLMLQERAYASIKQKIVEGQYAPGTFLSERRQAEELGMSKTPVRAAFQRLADQGLVMISPQRGVIVRDLNAREVSELYDFRIALETFVVRRLANGLTPGAHEELSANLARQREFVAAGDVEGFVNEDVKYHLALAKADGNEEIVDAMQRQTAKLQRMVHAIFDGDPRMVSRSVADHQAIFDCVLAGDEEAAAKRVTEHLVDSKHILLLGHRLP